MALLRNLRGISEEDEKLIPKIAENVKKGVLKGKQFPFRYYSAYNEVNHPVLKDALEECMDIALDNFPKLKGKTICLCDNSGSAQGAPVSSFSNVKVSTIANLSSIITGKNSDEGYIGVFGDGLEIIPISKRNGVLAQLEKANQVGKNIGQNTENGIWLFFDKALKGEIFYDNIFIYSDMQAGHGKLYGINPDEYSVFRSKNNSRYIDVLALVLEYRKKVNSKVNIYSVQVAGYDNSVLPENLYRTSVLSGWTGNETLYASKINEFWDSKELKQ
jgi:hypothetical protein